MSETPGATIMVVDDTPENLKLLDNVLRGRGCRVQAFPRGDLALQAAARNPPDLVLLDINLPGMSGFEVCRKLKEDETLREIPVLFISALTETTDKVKGFAVGGVDYVTKPFDLEEVVARVETHLALQRYRREIVRQKRELEASYARLRELEALRESLTQMVVHDLRSPLMGMMGYLDLLYEESGTALSEDSRELFHRAMAVTSELKSRIDTLLDVSRLDEGAMPLKPAWIDLGALARKVVAELGFQALDRSVLLETPDEGARASCDPDLLERVMANLLHNALKVSPRRSVLRITVESGDSSVRVSVHDEGPGVPPEFREVIFDRFQQVDAWKEGQRRGSGLGLAFCKLAVEAHGGSIGVDGPPEGGSDFWFRIPCGRP